MEAVQTSHERLPTPAATAPMENNTSGGTPLATQNAPVQSIPRSRAALGCAAAVSTTVAVLCVTRWSPCYLPEDALKVLTQSV